MRLVPLFLAAVISFAAWAQVDPSVLSKLREGGYVLYMRHASTDFSQNDANSRSYEDCANQRNLTDKGREEARTIGAHVKRLKIPIGAVLASPFCRTMETARLIFGHATASDAVRGGPVQPVSPAQYAPLREMLATPVKGATNLALVGHANPFRALAGGKFLAEGEAAVIEPRGKDGFRAVARVRPDEWRALETASK